MRRVYHVAHREFAEIVRTKAFIISLVAAPLLTVAIMYFAGGAGDAFKSERPTRQVVVVDRTGTLSEDLQLVFDDHNKSHADRQLLLTVASIDESDYEKAVRDAKGRLEARSIDAVADLASDAIDGKGRLVFTTRRAVAADFMWHETAQRLINRAVFRVRCAARQFTPAEIDALRRRVPLDRMTLDEGKGEIRRDKGLDVAAMMIPFAFMFLMYTGVMTTGQMMLTSIIEEKSSRIMEVLLSAVTPLELMAGKILGLAVVGLTMMIFWAGTGAAAAGWRGVDLGLEPIILVYFIIYYVLGYLLYASILAGIGSVCSNVKEAQSLMMPVVMMMVIPMVAWFNISQNSTGVLARTLSFLPTTAAMVMVLRLASGGEVASWEIALSFVLLIGSVIGGLWAAAKVFRIGVLLYGKRPGVREICRWIRQK